VSLTAVPAAAAGGATWQMVGLGDSYASGVGTGTYYQESGSCMRSPKAYPVLDSEQIGAVLSFVACSGATTADVEADQLGALSASTTQATITVGGNDIGFVEVITECALPSWASDCFGAIEVAETLMTTVLPGRLDTLYGDLSAAAPNATVVAVGYPRLFNGEDCSAGTFFTKAEEKALNRAAGLLDKTIHARASAAGFAFVDPRSAFAGHAICDPVPWVNNLTYPVTESFHPNVAGQAAYATLVLGHL
jgi:lysophospholipase L1-like esterase